MLKTSRVLEIIEELRVESDQISDSNYRQGDLFALAKLLDKISEDLDKELKEGTKDERANGVQRKRSELL